MLELQRKVKWMVAITVQAFGHCTLSKEKIAQILEAKWTLINYSAQFQPRLIDVERRIILAEIRNNNSRWILSLTVPLLLGMLTNCSTLI